MRKTRGFKIGKRLTCFTRWIFCRRRCSTRYTRLAEPEPTPKTKAIRKLMDWGRRLKTGAKSICSAKPGSGYKPVGEESVKPVAVPKGHLAVYVRQDDGEFHRVLVPVIYCNHPLFGELLKEAEEEYGFNQQGGITIPCRFSEFERVQTRIKSGSGCAARSRRLMWKRSHYY